MKKDIILVIGACGQIGKELTISLRNKYGRFNVIAADNNPLADILLDLNHPQELNNVVRECGVTQIYLLSSMPSDDVEQDENTTWKLNVQSLLSVLMVAKAQKLEKVFWPSSIAVFGPGSPKYNCPQQTRIEPNTIYGISKRTGEYWCNYYAENYDVDVRSLRFPGLISYVTEPSVRTEDYVADIFHHALAKREYTCYLSEDNCLPMMYISDAVRATMELMDAPKENIKVRTSYNLSGMSFAPCDLAAIIKTHIPEFEICYKPDYRNTIANGGPASIKDEQARMDWGWKPAFDLKSMATDMLLNLRETKRLGRLAHDQPDFPIDNYVFTKVFEE